MRQSQQARLDAIAELIARRVGLPAPVRGREPFTAGRWPDLIRPPVTIDDETLGAWLQERPDHPDLLELALRRRLRASEEPDDELMDLLDRYSKARPVDPFPHKQLARIWLDSPTPELAIPHLEALDAREQKTPVFAFELARQYRSLGDTDRALAKVTRACMIDPYDADWRELASAIAFEAGRLELTRAHILAMTLIEPDRPHHQKRLEAIDRLIAERSPAAFQR
jgi:tetratricopeptide (TPR) repeat protein